MSFKGRRRRRLRMRMRVKMVARRRKRLVKEVRIRGGIARRASLKVPRIMRSKIIGRPAA